MKVDGDILTITVNLKERFGRSKSGKTEIIATTGGNVSAPNNPDIKIGLNVYSK
jgi:hypothetical protein